MSYRATFLMTASCLVLSLLAGCWGRSRTAKGPDTVDGRSRPEVVLPSEGYAWDGQASVVAYRTRFDRAVNASVSALRQLGFSLDQSQSRRSLDAALLVGMNAQKRPAKVDVRRLSQAQIEVRATVGPAGDRSSSERLLDELSKSLGRAE